LIHRKKMKAAPSRLIPRKPTENLELLIVRKYAGPLLKKAIRFSTYRTWRRKFFNRHQQCSFWNIFCIILIFFQQLKAKKLSPNQHSWYNPATQFALPLKMQPSRQDTIVT